MKTIRVVLSDDQKEILDVLTSDLRAAGGFDVLGRAGNGQELLRLVYRYRPDVAVVDIRMPVMDGIAAAKAIKAKWPDVKLVMLTLFDDEAYLGELLKLGIDGYMLKGDAPDGSHLADVIRSVFRGVPTLDAAIMYKMGDILGGREEKSMLSGPEKKVACLIAQGLYNKDIARELDISYGHARNLVSSVYRKLGANSREEAHTKLDELLGQDEE